MMTYIHREEWDTLDGGKNSDFFVCELYYTTWTDGSEPIPRRKSTTGRKGIVHDHYGVQDGRQFARSKPGDEMDHQLRQMHEVVRGVS